MAGRLGRDYWAVRRRCRFAAGQKWAGSIFDESCLGTLGIDFMLQRRDVLLSCLFAGLLLAGCGGGPKAPACAPVQGSVKYKSKPLAEAIVVLHRIGGDVEGNQKPMATTDASGNFTLTTFHQNDGAPPGEYAITVELRAPQMAGEEMTRSGPNLLPPRYARPETSPVKYTVVEGDNVIPVIEIADR
jgi:hypothetical protein